jgi:hypothetical protein
MMAAFFAVMVGAVLLAWILATKRPEHRPVAVLLSIGLGVDVGRHVYDVAVLAPLRASLGVDVPWTGWARVAAFGAHAMTLAWPAAIVATALVVFAGKKPWAAVIAWAIVLAVLAVVHPIASDQAKALALVQALSIVGSAGIGYAWYRRTTTPATSAQFALAMIVTAELVSLFGAWRLGPFAAWPISQTLYLSMFGILVVIQGRFLWTPQRQPST